MAKKYDVLARVTSTQLRHILGGHFKTGQRGSPQKRPMEMARDGDVLPFRTSTVQARFGTPASGTALENVTVMEKAVQHRGDGGAVA